MRQIWRILLIAPCAAEGPRAGPLKTFGTSTGSPFAVQYGERSSLRM
jgi:hypothetical protein